MCYILCDFCVICMVILWKRYAQKFRSIILFQFALVTLRFAYMMTFKPQISMISGFVDVSLSPKTIYFYVWRHQDTQHDPRKKRKSFRNMICGKSRFVCLPMLDICVPHILKLGLYFWFLKFEMLVPGFCWIVKP